MRTHQIIYPNLFASGDHLLVAVVEDVLWKFGFEYSKQWSVTRNGERISVKNPEGVIYWIDVLEIQNKDQQLIIDYTFGVQILDEVIQLLPVY
jgi:hypothetical protein